ncbi:MAG: DUF5667 domain-containing protein [bacterium]|nr:DUF5667 domain-containing protein [bacterium]
MKKIVSIFIALGTILLVPIIAYFVLTASTPNVYAVQEKVLYNLPYPGILPDNPLYFVKIIRDRITEFAIRDNSKKAEFYLLTSDKRVAMAQALSKKGKDKMAIETYSKSEKYFLMIPPLVKESKKQGVGPTSGFIDILKLSNSKHREVGEILLKELPSGMSESVTQALKLNEEVLRLIEKL